MTQHRKTRFAPSPTGYIHLGNARTALFNRLFGQTFLLRIEDTDQERSRPEYTTALMEDLRWLKMDWDEGPASGQADQYFQSRRQAVYDRYYRQLEAQGRVYPCFCSPDDLARSRKLQRLEGKPPRYAGTCAHLKPDEIQARLDQGLEPTLRFRVPAGRTIEFDDLVRGKQRFDTDTIGDFIIRRADGTPAFFFCNAVDDALMEVTHVLRGEDHLTNTPRQLLILEALGLRPPRYGHISLIVGEDGAPLSKRNGSRSIRELRRQGYLPLAVINLLARLGHRYTDESLQTLEQLQAGFSIDHLSRSPARFDPHQLDYWQQQAVHQADDETLWQWLNADSRSTIPPEKRAAFLALVRSNCVFPDQAAEWATILFRDEFPLTGQAREILAQTDSTFFRTALEAFQAHRNQWKSFLQTLQAQSGVKGKRLFKPLRAALTGRLDGPELPRLHELLGAEKILTRLSKWA